MRSGLKQSLRRGLALAAMLTVAAPMWGQVMARPGAYAGVDATGASTTVEAALRGMTGQAAVMFVGTVTGVRRVGGNGFAAAAGVVEVSFAVERGIRGVGDGESYVLREWGGLWSASEQRYTVGSRLLMLLHAPGATGLSSPVGGMDGAIPVKGTSALVAAEDGSAGVNAPVADLRWVAAKVARPVAYSSRAARQPMAQTRGVVAGAQAAGSNLRVANRQPAAVSAEVETARLQDASVPTAQASVATVLQMMAAWQKETVDAR